MSEERPLRAPSQEPMKIGTVDVEEFSRNLARLVEEGARALAAYLKPREEGRPTTVLAEELPRNRPRLVEEGGGALAAYLKPREEGRANNDLAEEMTEVFKTLGQVAE